MPIFSLDMGKCPSILSHQTTRIGWRAKGIDMRQFFIRISGSNAAGHRASQLIAEMRFAAFAVGAILTLDLGIIAFWAITLGGGQ